MALTIVNWNVEWGRKRVRPEIFRRIAAHSPEIVCLTETDDGLLSELGGHAIRPDVAFGSGVDGSRRKVLLWSKKPWTDVDDLGDASLPRGRFVSGVTETSVGGVAVIGVCIPYHGSNVKHGQPAWGDHTRYLDCLVDILRRKRGEPLMVTGDFNQQIGQRTRPYPPTGHPVREKLAAAMDAADLTIATAALGSRARTNVRRAIDHIALSGDLCVESLGVIRNSQDKPADLSDHFGVVASLCRA